MSSVSRSIDISAPPSRVWALISDLPRMGAYSPENTGGRWVRGGGPIFGAAFRGTNRRGLRHWITWAYVTDAEPGRSFSFRVGAGPLTVTIWSYAIEPIENGCRVTETWQDRRGAAVARLGDLLSGEHDRAGFTVRSIDQTLSRIKSDAEGVAS